MAHLGNRAEHDAQGNITALDLSGLELTRLPPNVGHLTHLKTLNLANNYLATVPHAIGQLVNLRDLNLSENRLRTLPREIGNLRELRYLSLWGNNLTYLPAEIGKLENLRELDLSENRLPTLPPEIGALAKLQFLHLHGNGLRVIPPEIGRLLNLQHLYLSCNGLTELPPEISGLNKLQDLDLSKNQLRALPPDIAQLSDLLTINLEDNPLRNPPPEIVARGQSDVFDYLHDLAEDSEIRYEAKLLMVGEGATGKTSLLRALRGEPFIDGLATTHGIDIRRYCAPHPYLPGVNMTLNLWDFGGQQIYHTTHQFFLTKRSLYLLVWSARANIDQARLDHWLAKIQVLAPGSPIILVATHLDERPMDINYLRFKEAYPQLAGHIAVSNKDGTGIAELRKLIAREAARLPLMEQQWPKTWLNSEAALRDDPRYHLNLSDYTEICVKCGVAAEIAATALGGYLHDLGKILYHQDDEALSDFVVLKPNWLTKTVSRVLDDDAVRKNGGVLAHADLARIWDRDDSGTPYERRLFPFFLRLMEKYLISFKLENNTPEQQTTHSLVPLLLPYDPPAQMPPWAETLPGQPEINMVYRLRNYVPPGLMSWFIALTHRYTQGLHWREGVRLRYRGHQAEVVLNPSKRELWLRVRGPVPSNFFSILQHTINDRILEHYFEGLEYGREIPCNCHLVRGVDTPCAYFHDFERLVERMTQRKFVAECALTFAEVSVPLLLEGIHYTTDSLLAAKLEETHRALRELAHGQGRIIDITSQNRELLVKNAQLFEQLNRSFTRFWNLQMANIRAECPNTFILLPASRARFNPKNLFNTEFRLFLLCQNPTGPHVCRGDEGYRVPQAKEWWADVAPWLKRLVEFLRFIPTARDVAEAFDEQYFDDIDSSLDIYEAVVDILPEFDSEIEAEDLGLPRGRVEPFAAEGAALRALYTFLKKADKRQRWGGLHRTPTDDGSILWLCSEHRKLYQA
jgi:GTPase SAR1 family protein